MNKVTMAFCALSITAIAQASMAKDRPWCEVKHDQNFYADGTIRVSNYGLLDDIGNPCAKSKAHQAKAEASTATVQTVSANETSKDKLTNKVEELLNKRVVNLGVQFDLGSAKIRDSFSNDIAKLTEVLKGDEKVKITISGHTDNLGSEDLNKSLSESRAKAVRDALVANGIDGSRIAVLGLGSSQPKADNSTADGRAQNRRIEVVAQ